MSVPRPPSSRIPSTPPPTGSGRPVVQIPTTRRAPAPPAASPPPPPPRNPPPAAPMPGRLPPASRGAASFFDKPLLSTIDQYVLSSFVKHYLISMFVLIGMYVVLDMVFNFDEFVKVNNRDAELAETSTALHTIWIIADFYFFQSFRVFSHLAGIIPVVATAFTLVRMSRFNELAALLAAGRPLLRIAMPIIFASLVVNGLLLMLNQEVIVPRLMDKLTRERGEVGSELERGSLEAMPVGDRGLLFASRYTMARDGQPATMLGLHVLEKTSDGRTTQLAAERATYDPSTLEWNLTKGSLTTIAPAGSTQTPPGEVTLYEGPSKGAISPETIALFVSRGDFVDLLSTERIKQLLAQRTTVGRADLMRVRDARLANYVLNVVLVLLTIPCVLTREPTQLRTAAGRVFVLIGACMATIFITQNLAGQPPNDPSLATTWPAIMAWLPIVIFAPIAILLLDRLKT